jgi:hypothetical protein
MNLLLKKGYLALMAPCCCVAYSAVIGIITYVR